MLDNLFKCEKNIRCRVCNEKGSLDEMTLSYDEGWRHKKCVKEIEQMTREDEVWDFIQDKIKLLGGGI